MCFQYIFSLIACYVFVGIVIFVESGKVRVVDAPFSFNNPLGSINPHPQTNQEKKLILRFDPEEPSGPPFLIKKLNGKCFNMLHNNYKYEFCPFQNVTQREQTYRYNSYHGVLGVWKHWTIENNYFKQMEMMHGDICLGTQERQVSVVLKCGEEPKIVSVTEPETCKYKLLFKTPYACPIDVFQVFPVLSEQGRQQWKSLQQQYKQGILTEKGFHKRQKKILLNEGLYKEAKESRQKSMASPINNDDNKKDVGSSRQTKDTVEQNTNNTTNLNGQHGKTTHFISRHQCVQAYEKLYEEVTELREKIKMLDVNSNHLLMSNSTTENIMKYKPGDSAETSNENKDDQVKSQHLNGEQQQQQQQQSLHQRGDDGLVDEETNPLRRLQSRSHRN